jgi:hypothetical protein
VKQEVDGKVNGVAAVAEQLETSLNVSTTDGKREPEGDAKKTVLSFGVSPPDCRDAVLKAETCITLFQPVFVTGNANKLKEVKAILAAGTSGIDVTNQGVDGESLSRPIGLHLDAMFTREMFCRNCSP